MLHSDDMSHQDSGALELVLSRDSDLEISQAVRLLGDGGTLRLVDSHSAALVGVCVCMSCVCVCVCVSLSLSLSRALSRCMYYTHTLARTHTQTCMYICLYNITPKCIYMCVCRCVGVCVCVCVYGPVQLRTHARMHAQTKCWVTGVRGHMRP